MLYKTMVLELLQQRHELHEQLRQSRTLLGTVTLLATELKDHHNAWKERLAQDRPGSPSQVASEALEIALSELEASLPTASNSPDDEADSLDEAMAFLRAHTPPA